MCLLWRRKRPQDRRTLCTLSSATTAASQSCAGMGPHRLLHCRYATQSVFSCCLIRVLLVGRQGTRASGRTCPAAEASGRIWRIFECEFCDTGSARATLTCRFPSCQRRVYATVCDPVASQRIIGSEHCRVRKRWTARGDSTGRCSPYSKSSCILHCLLYTSPSPRD